LQFANPSVDALWQRIASQVELTGGRGAPGASEPAGPIEHEAADLVNDHRTIIRPDRTNYLAEIAYSARNYYKDADGAAKQARLAQQLAASADHMASAEDPHAAAVDALRAAAAAEAAAVPEHDRKALAEWPALAAQYDSGELTYYVRGKAIKAETTTKSLSHLDIPKVPTCQLTHSTMVILLNLPTVRYLPKVALPRFQDQGEMLRWMRRENLPGSFPYTAGVFPVKRQVGKPHSSGSCTLLASPAL
jgi:methylmalonyl-CoA mutase